MMRQARWEELSEFPDSNGEWEALYPLLNFGLRGKKRVEKHIRTTNILAPILITTPESEKKFVPPIFVGDGQKCAKKIIQDKKAIMYICLVSLILISTTLYFITDSNTALVWFALNSVLLIYSKYDYELLSRGIEIIRKRAQFYAWMYCHGVKHIISISISISIFMAVIGAMQIFGIWVFGSNSILLENYGFLYSAVASDGEWWRVLTGPFLHADLAHWLSNTLFGCAFFLLGGTLLGRRSILIFLSCAVISFFFVYQANLLFDFGRDGIIGVSGGMAGLIGSYLALNIKDKELFPVQFYISIMFMVTMTLLLASFFLSTTSFICHLSGLLLGLGLGFTLDLVDSSFLVEDQPPASQAA